jgi:hypothetical protein
MDVKFFGPMLITLQAAKMDMLISRVSYFRVKKFILGKTCRLRDCITLKISPTLPYMADLGELVYHFRHCKDNTSKSVCQVF